VGAAPLLVDTAVIFSAGVVAGAINAVAGGGTLLSFPVLIWAGRDPIVANATNALALCPGSLAGAWGLRRELGGGMDGVPDGKRLLRWLLAPAAVGAALGGWLLLETPSQLFSSLVPWLILLATGLVASQRWIQQVLPAPSASRSRAWGAAALVVAQLAVSVYGGYFGAGMGIIMLAALGFYGVSDILQRNALKNVLATVINAVASAYFVAAGAIAWRDAAVLAAGSILGGLLGAAAGRRIGRRAVEIVVVLIGLAMAVSFLIRQRV
jgi:uncharacterized membrane protein YfcA